MKTGVEVGWGGAQAEPRWLERAWGAPPSKDTRVQRPTPHTLTQPSGHGAGEAGSKLDQAGRGSWMQMILTSFLEVWGLSPPLVAASSCCCRHFCSLLSRWGVGVALSSSCPSSG